MLIHPVTTALFGISEVQKDSRSLEWHVPLLFVFIAMLNRRYHHHPVIAHNISALMFYFRYHGSFGSEGCFCLNSDFFPRTPSHENPCVTTRDTAMEDCENSRSFGCLN